MFWRLNSDAFIKHVYTSYMKRRLLKNPIIIINKSECSGVWVELEKSKRGWNVLESLIILSC